MCSELKFYYIQTLYPKIRVEKQGGGGGVTPIDPVLPPATGVKTLVKWPR